MKKQLPTRRIRTGLAALAIAGGTAFGATQLAGSASAQTDDTAPADAPPAEAGTPPSDERPQGPRGRRGAGLGIAAEQIGIDGAALREALREGDTIAGVASANGVDPQGVIDAMVAEATERIDQALADGRLTAEEADEKLAAITERITTHVTEGRPDRPEATPQAPADDN